MLARDSFQSCVSSWENQKGHLTESRGAWGSRKTAPGKVLILGVSKSLGIAYITLAKFTLDRQTKIVL